MNSLSSSANNGDDTLNKETQMQSQHSSIIGLVINKVTRLKKECRSRRYRELLEKITDVENVLTKFKDADWPPKVNVTPPEWINENGNNERTSSDVESNTKESDTEETSSQLSESIVSSNDHETTKSQSKNSLVEETTAPFDELEITEKESSPVYNEKDNSTEINNKQENVSKSDVNDLVEKVSILLTKEGSSDSKSINNDSSHPTYSDVVEVKKTTPSILFTIQILCQVIGHPQKTSKMCEVALDCITTLATNGYISGQAGVKIGPNETQYFENLDNSEEDYASKPFFQYTIDTITKCSESSSDIVQITMAKALLALMTSPKCGIHEASMLTVVRSVFHVYLVSKSDSAKDVSKASLLDMLRSVFSRVETYSSILKLKQDQQYKEGENESKTDDNRNPASPIPGPEDPVVGDFISQFHKDGFLLFRALCKLSSKSLPGDDKSGSSSSNTPKILQSFSTSIDPLAMQSKILSLELILFIFEHCGMAFRNGEKFIYAVQHYLCVSLLKNCMSSHTDVAYHSLKLFLALVYNFKAYLKSEIEIFVADIFLKVLESPNSPFEQKAMVLEALRALCSDPLMLTQIFLNYDCDFDAVNLYKDIVHSLTRLCTKGSSQLAMTKKDTTEESKLKSAGLEVLVVILQAFLKALNLPGGDEELNSNSTVRKLDVEDALSGRKPAQSNKNDKQDIAIFSDEINKLKLTEASDEVENMAAKVVGAFDRKRIAQQNFETGLVKFKLSLKGGILFFIENEFVNLDAKALADFFHAHKERLDKTQIGEALGKEPEYAFVKDKDAQADVGGEGFFMRVLHYYVDAMDFTGLKFDNAIRLFLSGFRLPGEAQKIDRIMEKFAECFTRQNEDVFASADTAFILGFSVIMLNTDLHNPNIKPEKKMTVESFIKMNRGISVDGSDLPDDFLIGIFNRIQKNPFTLKEDDDARAKASATSSIDSSILFESSNIFGSNAEERKREKFRKEREELMNATEQLFKKRPSKTSSSSQKATYMMEFVSPSDVVKPMFDVTWGPLIGAFSQLLEKTEDSTCTSICLNGFVFAIRLASHSDMSVARETFVSSLAKFTTLGSIREMKSKNIECIRTLLSIAIIDGDRLGESWGLVLQCISQLGRLTLSASGLRRDDEFLLGEQKEDIEPGGFFRNSSSAEIARETEENNGRAILAAVNDVLIEKVFSSSVNLSGRGIVHFIHELVKVSATELDGESSKGITGVISRTSISNKSRHSGHDRDGPRIFSLQKLVEVAGYNMDVRSRISWTSMWEMMATHFVSIGCHKNAMVSMFAIDALRQLSFKFLAKPELADFNFQRLFLRPFLLIMENPGSREDIRELVLQCVDNMIRMMSHNLRSGWKIFLSILTLSAADTYEKINTLGLAILQRILDKHLDDLCKIGDDKSMQAQIEGERNEHEHIMSIAEKRTRNAKAEDFISLCRASLAFMNVETGEKSIPIGLSMRALCHIACYADVIAEKKVSPPISISQSTDPSNLGYTYDGLEHGDAEEMVLWRPILDGINAGICSPIKSNSGGVGCLVQRASIMTLRAILLRHGSIFSTNQWSVILAHVVVPAIESSVKIDNSAIATIVSESPIESSLDFLLETLPLPPPDDDEGLQKFALDAQNEDSAPHRPFGPAELLVEASFADLRHGGDGNLSQAFKLTKKGYDGKNVHDRPFPDSWIATSAPMALGMLTDVLCDKLLDKGQEGRDHLWPIIWNLYRSWVLGPDSTVGNESKDSSDFSNDAGLDNIKPIHCEALVRMGCKEINRIGMGFMNELAVIDNGESTLWWNLFSENLAEIISKNAELERNTHEELVSYKLDALGLVNSKEDSNSILTNGKSASVNTIFGLGQLVQFDSNEVDMTACTRPNTSKIVISLEWGGTLYSPEGNQVLLDTDQPVNQASPRTNTNDSRALSRENYLDRYIPALKIRSTATHMLQQGIPEYAEAMAKSVAENDLKLVLQSLEESRHIANQLNFDEDLAHAFQESWRSEWGDGVLEVELALAAMGGSSRHQGGSEVFFLTQEASSNLALIKLLSYLYSDESNLDQHGLDNEMFSEQLLFERMNDVLEKFLQSETKNSHLIDPNFWNSSNVQSGKVVVYCTSFYGTVVGILQVLRVMNKKKFDRCKQQIFPLMCSLVKVQSIKIRELINDIFREQVGPLIGVISA